MNPASQSRRSRERRSYSRSACSSRKTWSFVDGSTLVQAPESGHAGSKLSESNLMST